MGNSELRETVAASCRILHRLGHEHFVYGHVSARGEDGEVWVKGAGRTLAEVTAEDVVGLDLDGRPLAEGARLHDEMPLHLEIYRARPDVGAVVHTHAESVVVACLTDQSPAAVSQDAVPFIGRLGYYDRADLVTTAADGRAFAAALGEGRGALMRAHGLVTVGEDVAEATVNAALLERALRIQLAAMAADVLVPMDDADLKALDARFERARRRRIDDIWDSLIRIDSGQGPA